MCQVSYVCAADIMNKSWVKVERQKFVSKMEHQVMVMCLK